MRRLVKGRPIAPKIPPTQIINEKKNKIRLLLSSNERALKKCGNKEQERLDGIPSYTCSPRTSNLSGHSTSDNLSSRLNSDESSLILPKSSP